MKEDKFLDIPGKLIGSDLDRFFSYVNKNGPIPSINPDLGPCWLWTGYVDPLGYAKFWLKGGRYYVHRISYQYHVKKMPNNLAIDHLCKTRNCINPKHLEPKTRIENILAKGSLSFSRINKIKTHCPRGHEYTKENTYVNKKKRSCKICTSDWQKIYQLRSKVRKIKSRRE